MKCFIRCLVAVSSLFVLLPAHSSLAQINVFVDWSGFELRLNEATAAAGVSSFSAAEVTTIKSNVFNDITSHYDGFSINFSESNPGGDYETIVFALSGTGYGLADSIDFN